jgi:hypothetical protein
VTGADEQRTVDMGDGGRRWLTNESLPDGTLCRVTAEARVLGAGHLMLSSVYPLVPSC